MATSNARRNHEDSEHRAGQSKQHGPSSIPGGNQRQEHLVDHPVDHPVEDSVRSLDRLIHEKVRLSIVSALAANTSLTFKELKQLLGASDGNLSVHARKLEDAGYITCGKSFEGRMPKTEYALTAAGRKAFEKYLDHMEALLHALRPEQAAK